MGDVFYDSVGTRADAAIDKWNRNHQEEEAMMPQYRGGARLNKLLTDPKRAARVAAIRDQMRDDDRAYAINLALIRQAADLTQVELAQRLGVGQAAVSKVEHQHDLLLSTLASYMLAAGAQARIVVTVAGRDIEFDLASLQTQ